MRAGDAATPFLSWYFTEQTWQAEAGQRTLTRDSWEIGDG